MLEEGRSKVLLASVPAGLGAAEEVAKRLTLWEERRFVDLLRRPQEHLLVSRKAGKRRQRDGQLDPLARADRARRTAAFGAYRKATTGLVSSMLSFEENEDLARRPTVTRCWSPGSALRWIALRGLTAPGPTGTRAKHITDMLSVPRRVHANKLNAVLSALFCGISAGTLTSAARWLTAHAALLAAQEKWQAEAHQDGRVPAHGLRQGACEPAPCHPPIQGPAHTPVGHQPTR